MTKIVTNWNYYCLKNSRISTSFCDSCLRVSELDAISSEMEANCCVDILKFCTAMLICSPPVACSRLATATDRLCTPLVPTASTGRALPTTHRPTVRVSFPCRASPLPVPAH